MEFAFVDEVFHLEVRGAHGNLHGFGFIAACHNASVVVGKDNNGYAFQPRTEHAFAADEEIIAVDDAKHMRWVAEWGQGVSYLRFEAMT